MSSKLGKFMVSRKEDKHVTTEEAFDQNSTHSEGREIAYLE